MAFCIYHQKNEEYLRFDKEEHVIPAGLGGITKLKKGIVSDEANEMFSKIETKALRNSLIAMNRMNLGPGKRGNLNVKKIKNPIMRVLHQEEKANGAEFLLGFIYAGKSYIIPQLVLDFNDEENSVLPLYITSTFHEENIKSFPLDFNKKLRGFLKNYKRKYQLVKMPFETSEHFINIGFYKGKWYATTSHKIINMDFLALEFLPMVEDMIKDQIVYKEDSVIPDNKPIFKYTETLNMESAVFYFLYVKTAFNALALFKGSEFVSDKIYDRVRKAILTQENLDDFINKKKMDINREIIDYINSFPDKSHYIIINVEDNIVNAFVSFYGESPATVQLTNEYLGEPFLDGLICDWKNRNEFRLQL
ncbi:hypothetical protein [Bacillus smithii]|uniref:hypothetical protein n=1 Tax=Bacillus smithii TaxID=1479 RepID=UPI002E1D76D2|nr:hypothetical protein [Bacillus smithii]